MGKIVAASRQDYEEMVSLANYAFPHELGVMEQRWRHVWGSSEEYLKNFLLYKEGARIAGMLGIVPMVLEWEGEKIDTTGISSVATHPEYRRRNIMSQLLVRAEEEMLIRGSSISVLTGDRHRYGHFGWELVGNAVRINYDGKYLAAFPEAQSPPVEIRADTDHTLLDEILRLNAEHNPRFSRSRQQLKVLLGRPGVSFWAVRDNGRIHSYIGAFDNTIAEYRGRAEEIPGLIRHLAAMRGSQQVAVWIPPLFGRVEEALLQWSGDWQVRPLFSLRILSFPSLMEKLIPALASNTKHKKLNPFQATLIMEETRQAVVLSLEEGGTKPQVKAAPAEEPLRADQRSRAFRLSLPRREMARLLFGPFPEGVLTDLTAGQAQSLLQLFPLPIHCSQIDMI